MDLQTSSDGGDASTHPQVHTSTGPQALTSSVRAQPGVARISPAQFARRVTVPRVVASPVVQVTSSPAVCLAAATEAPEQAVAFLRYSRGSALKVRRVLDQIRGRSYEEALMILEYMPYQACEPVIKTLLSAAANAKNNLGMKKKDLYVSECFADEGPVMKRYRPRAQGRANRILKPTVHITVKVAERV